MRKIVLVGNPNVGKSVFFNHYSGMYVDVSNFPGTTVEISKAKYKGNLVVDTPGIYSVGSLNDEEKVARDIIIDADVVLNVVDATHLERDLFLTQQLIDMGKPLIVALNFMDEAKKEGIEIDIDSLKERLGVEVIPTVATENKGIRKIDFSDFRKGNPCMAVGSFCDNRAESLLIMEGDKVIAKKHLVKPVKNDAYVKRREKVDEIVKEAVEQRNMRKKMNKILTKATTHPLLGLVVLVVILYLLYQFVGVFIAQTVVGITEETIMQGYYEPAVRSLLSFISPESAVGAIMYGEFGLFTMTVTYLLGLLLPLVLGFYIALSIMEDSGYLPRLAALVDRMLNFIGLNGKAVIPIILGFGCVTCATITTRILGTKREKTIASTILQFAIPCSAQLGVIAALLAIVGKLYLFSYVAIIFAFLVILGTMLNAALPGKSSQLLIHLPPLRFPRLGNVFKKTYIKTFSFMKEAAVWFFAGALIVGLMQVTGILVFLQEALKPLVVGFLQLPKEAATAFIMGLVRRDFGAAGLYDMALSPAQILVSLVTITLFVPCVASLMILYKERGWKPASVIWIGTWVISFLVGGIISQIII